MNYILLIYQQETEVPREDHQKCYEQSSKLAHDLVAEGKYLAAAPLHPTCTATTVRVRDGKRLVTDGPFAETREQLGGYFLVKAENLDDAISIAERIPAARYGTVEVRPVLDMPELP